MAGNAESGNNRRATMLLEDRVQEEVCMSEGLETQEGIAVLEFETYAPTTQQAKAQLALTLSGMSEKEIMEYFSSGGFSICVGDLDAE